MCRGSFQRAANSRRRHLFGLGLAHLRMRKTRNEVEITQQLWRVRAELLGSDQNACELRYRVFNVTLPLPARFQLQRWPRPDPTRSFSEWTMCSGMQVFVSSCTCSSCDVRANIFFGRSLIMTLLHEPHSQHTVFLPTMPALPTLMSKPSIVLGRRSATPGPVCHAPRSCRDPTDNGMQQRELAHRSMHRAKPALDQQL